MDQSLFNALYQLSGQSLLGDWLIVFLGKYLLYVLLAVVAAFAVREWLRGGERVNLYYYAVALLGALIARFGVAEFVRYWYPHERPFVALGLPTLITDHASSFPSGHTIFIFALATGLFFVHRKLAYGLYAAGVLVGLARIAAGVHWPSDIVGGAVLGIMCGTAALYTARYIQTKRPSSRGGETALPR